MGQCVKYERSVASNGGVAALFPITREVRCLYEPEREKKGIEVEFV